MKRYFLTLASVFTVALLLGAACSAPGARPSAVAPGQGGSPTSPLTLADAQQTIDAANYVATSAVQTAHAAVAQATEVAYATQLAYNGAATVQAQQTQAAFQATALAQQATAVEGTRIVQATEQARVAQATEQAQHATGTALAQALVLQATQTQAWAHVQLTRVALTAEADLRAAESERQTQAVRTWSPWFVGSVVLALLILAAFVVLRAMEVQLGVVRDASGNWALLLRMPGGKNQPGGVVVHRPELQLHPSAWLGARTAPDVHNQALSVSEPAALANARAAHATRAVGLLAHSGGLASPHARELAGETARAIGTVGDADSYALPIPRVRELDTDETRRRERRLQRHLPLLPAGRAGPDGEDDDELEFPGVITGQIVVD